MIIQSMKTGFIDSLGSSISSPGIPEALDGTLFSRSATLDPVLEAGHWLAEDTDNPNYDHLGHKCGMLTWLLTIFGSGSCQNIPINRRVQGNLRGTTSGPLWPWLLMDR